jgi:cob(I)alamin adenosyltransferase
MKLYTKRGDDGSTGLFGGLRVTKCDLRVVAYGEVDETNAAIGLAIAECHSSELQEWLLRIQADLFVVGAELATPEGRPPTMCVAKEQVVRLERWIDDLADRLAPLKTFILPGGCEFAARLHLARGVCRRAERAVVALAEKQSVARSVVVYLNRLSDLLFAFAREANRAAGCDDIPWETPD